MAPSSLRIKSKALTMAQKSLHNLVPITSLIFHSPHHSLFSNHIVFLKHVRYLPPPTSEPLYLLVSHLKYSSSQIIWLLTHPLPVCSNVTSLEKHSLTDISKTAPFTSTFYPLILLYVIFFYKSLMTNWYIYLLWSVCLSTIDCKLHKAKTVVLSIVVSLVLRIVHSHI